MVRKWMLNHAIRLREIGDGSGFYYEAGLSQFGIGYSFDAFTLWIYLPFLTIIYDWRKPVVEEKPIALEQGE